MMTSSVPWARKTGGFLVVQTAAGERYTRDEGLQINGQGQLVTAAGNPVLGTSGPIVFQGDVRAGRAGRNSGGVRHAL
jgi:flagellar basal body rod protein FlgG